MRVSSLTAFGTCLLHMVLLIYSCNGTANEDSQKNKNIQIECERRNWTETISIPIGPDFVKEDRVENFWPLSAEDENEVFISKNGNSYLIVKYCENHYEGEGPLNAIADDYLAKIQDTGAIKLSSDSDPGAFICEHVLYSASFGQDVYLATKIIKAGNDIVTIFGMNIECCSDNDNGKLYPVLKNTKLYR